MRVSRADRSRLAEWWFTVDHALVSALLLLVTVGLVLALAASPAVAIKKGFDPYHFVNRHAFFAAVGIVVMLTVSFLDQRSVRRLALVVLSLSLVAMVAVLLVGQEMNGARRWLSIAGHSLQPSEFAKPAFVVVSGWLLAEAHERPEMPALLLAILLVAVLAGLLLMQPDVGQTLLCVVVWGALFFASGQPLKRAGFIVLVAAVGLIAAYFIFPHVQYRIDRFLTADASNATQVGRAIQSFSEGGLLGRGPGEGTIKTSLPDAHTDFIFAVVAEEYGAAACLALAGLYAFVVLRAMARALSEPAAATRLSIMGLSLLIGVQAMINMGVNVGLLPAKGMTLPFISAGGSSLVAVSLTAGMALALTRRRPHHARLKRQRADVRPEQVQSMGQAARD